jgi:hypothetical protein
MWSLPMPFRLNKTFSFLYANAAGFYPAAFFYTSSYQMKYNPLDLNLFYNHYERCRHPDSLLLGQFPVFAGDQLFCTGKQ